MSDALILLVRLRRFIAARKWRAAYEVTEEMKARGLL